MSFTEKTVEFCPPASQPAAKYSEILRVSAVRPRNPMASFKVHFKDGTPSQWLDANLIPEEMIIAFHLEKHRKRLEKQNM